MPTNPLMPLAGRIKYTEGEPYENGSLGKKVSELSEQITNSSGSADWDAAEGQPGYIANKPFYTNGSISIPGDAQDGSKVYWEGPTGNEVLGVDKFAFFVDTHGGEASESEGDSVYGYKVSDRYISAEDFASMDKNNIYLNYIGERLSLSELEEMAEGEVQFSFPEVVPGVTLVEFAGYFALLISFEEDFDMSTLGQEGIAPAGTYFIQWEIDEGMSLSFSNLCIENVKKIDEKYLPNMKNIIGQYIDEAILGRDW